MGKEQELIAKLESDMERYDRIVLVCGRDVLLSRTAELLCHLQEENPQEKRLLLLSPDVPCEAGENGIPVQRISHAETQMLCRLYDMYEFSDRFHILSREEQYGGLLNFVDTGLLSAEEMLDALLH